jgi:hypothetical protein
LTLDYATRTPSIRALSKRKAAITAAKAGRNLDRPAGSAVEILSDLKRYSLLQNRATFNPLNPDGNSHYFA